MSFSSGFLETADIPDGSVTVASFHLFHKKAADHVLSMGDYARAAHAQKGAFVLPRPAVDDYFLNIDGTPTVHRKYPVTAATVSDPEALTAEGHRLFSAAMQSYESLLVDKKKEQANFVAWLLRKLAPSSKTYLASFPTYLALKDSISSYELYALCVSSHNQSTSLAISTQFASFVRLEQGQMSHEHYVEALRDASVIALANFGSKVHPGFIEMNTITSAVYLAGIDQIFFGAKKDHFLASNPGLITDTWGMVNGFQQFWLEHQPVQSSPSLLSSSLVAAVLPATTSRNPSRRTFSGVPCSSCVGRGVLRVYHELRNCHFEARRRDEPQVRAVPNVTPPRRSVVPPKSHLKSDITVMRAAVAQYDHAEAQAAFSRAQGFVTHQLDVNDDDDCEPQQSWHLCVHYPDLPPTDSPCIAAVSSQVIPPSLSLCFYDNACSYHTTNCISLLYQVEPVNPFEIGGIGSGVKVTHKGFLTFLPPAFSLCYFTPSSAVTLLVSLGYLVRHGGNYHPEIDSSGSPTLRVSCGTFLDISPLTLSNLSPVSSQLLRDSVPLSGLANLYDTARHFSAEELRGADAAEAFHRFSNHISDDICCEGLQNGYFPGVAVTCRDIRNNRLLRGLCPGCLAGKMHNRSFRASPSSPPVHSGEELYIDVVKLSVPTKRGSTHKFACVDKFSGRLDIVSGPSKSQKDVFAVIYDKLVVNCYLKYGNITKVIHTDSESVFAACEIPLAKKGLLLILSSPSEHQRRIERYIQTNDQRVVATLSSCSYVLPPEYHLYCDIACAYSANSLPNSRSRPSTPFELTTGRKVVPHYKYPMLEFGATCMVQQFHDKREAIAKRDGIDAKHVAKAELGVCMGPSPLVSGGYLFLLGNGEVCPRTVVERVNVIPFNFKPQYVPVSQIRLSAASRPAVLPFPENPLDPLNELLPSQLPAAPLAFSPPFNGAPIARSILPSMVDISPLPPVPVAPPSAPVVPLLTAVLSPPSTSVLVPPLPPAVDTVPFSSPLSTRSSRLRHSNPSLPLLEPQQVVPSPVAVIPASSTAPTRSVRFRQPNQQYGDFVCNAAICPPLQPQVCVSSAFAFAAIAARDDLDANLFFNRQSLPVTSTSIARSKGSRKRYHVRALRAQALADTKLFDDAINEHIALMASAPSIHDAHTFATRQPDELTLSETYAFLSTTTSVASLLLPMPSTKCHEVPLKRALSERDPVAHALIVAAVAKEMHKVTDQYKAIRPIAACDMSPHAVHLYSSMLTKVKADGRVTARLVPHGNRQPPDSYDETFAPCVADESKLLLVASFQAASLQDGLPLMLSDFDVPGAFLNIDLKSPRQILIHLPKDLPHPLAGTTCEVLKALYGLKQSNHLFSLDMTESFLSAGFHPTPSDPCIFIRTDPENPSLRCGVSMTVDDGLVVYTEPKFYKELLAVLTTKYGPMTQHDVCTRHTGQEISYHKSGAITFTQAEYISRVCSTIGVAHLPPVSTPSKLDLFHASVNTAPADKALYQRIVGCLVHALKTRADIVKEATYFTTKLLNPTEDDLAKALHTLRYLGSTPNEGLTFFTKEGPVLCAKADAAFAVHRDGYSQSGFYLSIGTTSAPIVVKAHSQKLDVALSPMSAEYYTLSEVSKAAVHGRQLLSDLGFPQNAPTVIFEDNLPAINLAISPQITRRSRHIFVRHHYIRDLVHQKVVTLQHQATVDMTADLLTKPLSPTRFRFLRSRLLNTAARTAGVAGAGLAGAGAGLAGATGAGVAGVRNTGVRNPLA